MCPDGDFYEALRSGKGSIVTGHIETVTDKGIKIKDQPESTLEADVIVTATGLKILTGGGAKAAVDGKAVPIPEKLLWKGCMLQDLPNCLSVVGYTNASWTLGADVAMKTLTRLMAHQRKHGYLAATPTISKERDIQAVPFMKMDSTYLLKGRGEMPKAGDKYPWLARGSYFSDMRDATWGDITQDMVCFFSEPMKSVFAEASCFADFRLSAARAYDLASLSNYIYLPVSSYVGVSTFVVMQRCVNVPASSPSEHLAIFRCKAAVLRLHCAFI